MRSNRRRDTKPELAIRRLLHARGLRYRVDQPLEFDRRRRADIVFTSVKFAVFIDGCFWHGCPEHYSVPVTNADFWAQKRRMNMERDAETTRRLLDEGWTVARYWEHDDPAAVAQDVESRYRAAKTAHAGRQNRGSVVAGPRREASAVENDRQTRLREMLAQ